MKIAKVLLNVLLVTVAGCGSGNSAQKKPYVNNDGYPLSTCVVSGEKLGEMGEPHVIQYQGKTVKLCCSSCLKEFNADPVKYMKVIEEAEKKAQPAK